MFKYTGYTQRIFTSDQQVRTSTKRKPVKNAKVAIIIQQNATEYSLFKSVKYSTCFGWYFTHHQELITLYLQYLALMKIVILPVVNVTGRELT